MSEELSEDAYGTIRPYWEAWKGGHQESEYFDGMVEIFRVVAGYASTKANREAVDFVLKSLPYWRSRLAALPSWDNSADRLKLYRGITDSQAILFRKAIKNANHFREPALEPICYTTHPGVALGFARRGHIDGSVYSIAVSLDSVLFADLDGLYKEGGLHREKEVVVWHDAPMIVEATDIDKLKVPPQQPPLHRRSDRQKWALEKQRLEDEERH